jgi:hypothetical protein
MRSAQSRRKRALRSRPEPEAQREKLPPHDRLGRVFAEDPGTQDRQTSALSGSPVCEMCRSATGFHSARYQSFGHLSTSSTSLPRPGVRADFRASEALTNMRIGAGAVAVVRSDAVRRYPCRGRPALASRARCPRHICPDGHTTNGSAQPCKRHVPFTDTRPADSLRGVRELRRSERKPWAWDVSRDKP